MPQTALDRSYESAVYDYTLPARFPWSRTIRKGQTLRIVDLGGCQAVDTLLYNAEDTGDRYSAPNTIRTQGNIFLTVGTKLISSEGNVLATITADTCGKHDTSGGACSAESNSARFGLDKRHMHNCRDNFLLELSRLGMDKRDLVSNINFFMNVPVSPDGTLEIVDGISDPGSYVDMVANRDVIVVISNCPQMNNPCNGYNPTPIRLLVWDA
jgi:urea carboxylase-associated protein 1